ncbi:QueT transporter family protein [Zhaonella formicivorans]|jgi:uncharacterized membrane protein|uniref:QueT transporter family protein n=1 Tax=Zhaonella formicivorans TaxID=2528593 RepID=UPI001D0FA447|nr:QueT transporter family protein [Zhaonella formicivorans]
MQAKGNPMIKKSAFSAKQIAISGVVMAVYIVLMYLTQSFAFGQYQIRIATSLYALSAVYPFLIVPLAISNLLSNALLGGLGMPDMIGGFLVGLITSTAVYLIKKFNLNERLIALPIIFGPGLIVPIWLSVLIDVPYRILAASICIGQIIPGIVGVILVKHLQNKIREN